MIRAHDAIAAARALIGTPYRELDCIGLIVRVIRTAPGGVPGYRTAGTNTLWKSADGAKKYRDLTWRQEGIAGARAGMLAFKRSGDDVHHVGIVACRPQCGKQAGGASGIARSPKGDYASSPDIVACRPQCGKQAGGASGIARSPKGDYASSPGLVTDELTVIHSSSVRGRVMETALDSSWDLLGIHRYIEVAEATEEEDRLMFGNATVTTNGGALNIRAGASTRSNVIAEIPNGSRLNVLRDTGIGWLFVKKENGETGYVSAAYVEEDEPETAEPELPAEGGDPGIIGDPWADGVTRLIGTDGTVVTLLGNWRAAED